MQNDAGRIAGEAKPGAREPLRPIRAGYSGHAVGSGGTSTAAQRSGYGHQSGDIEQGRSNSSSRPSGRGARGQQVPGSSGASRHASAGVTERNDESQAGGPVDRDAHAGARSAESKPPARHQLPEDDAESTDDEAAVQAAAVLSRRARSNVGYMKGLLYAERQKPTMDSMGGNVFTAFSPHYDHPWMWAHAVQHIPRSPASYPLWPVLSVAGRGNIQRFGAIRDRMGQFRFWWELPEDVQDEPARIARTARSILKATRGADAVYLSDTARPFLGWCFGNGSSRRAADDDDDGTVVGGAGGLSTLDTADGLYSSSGQSTWDADVRRALRLARAYERAISVAVLQSNPPSDGSARDGWVLRGGATRASRARGGATSVWLPPHVGPVDRPAVVGGSGDVNTQASHGAALILPPRTVPAVLHEGTSLVRSIAAKKRSADPNAAGDVILDAGELAPGERASSNSADLRVTAQRPILGDAGDVTMQAAARSAAQRLKAAGKSDAAAAEAAAAVLGGTRSRLLMRVHSVSFDDHALATEEDWLAAKLRSDHVEYAQRLQADIMGTSDARIEAVLPLHSFTDAAGQELSSRDVWERDLASRQGGRMAQADAFGQDDDMSLLLRARQAVQLLSSRHEEWVQLGRMATSMYHTWRQIREARTRAGVTCTPVTLLINKVEDAPGAREGGAVSSAACPPPGAVAALEALLDKCRERFVNPAAVAARATAVAHHESQWEERRFRQGGQAEAEDPSASGPPELPAPSDPYWRYYPSVGALLRSGDALLARMRAVMSGAALGTVAAGGIAGDGQAYALRLAADDTIVTPEHSVNPPERARRMAAARTRIYTKILVNGKPLTESEHTGGVLTSATQSQSRAVPLRIPGFAAEVGQEVQLQPYARPNTIEVEVWQRGGALRGGTWGDSLVASVLLPIPGTGAQDGAPTEGIPPVSGAFEFASNRELLRFRGEAVKPDPSLAWQGDVRLAPGTASVGGADAPAEGGVMRVDRRLRGVVRVHLEWAPGVLPARPVRLQLSNLRVSVTGLPEPKWGAGGLHFSSGQGPPSSALLIPPIPVGGVNTKKLIGPDALDPTSLAPPGSLWQSPANTPQKGRASNTEAIAPTTPHRRDTLGGTVNLPDPNDPRARGMRALAPSTTDEGGEGGLKNPLTAAMEEAGMGAGGELTGPTGVLRPFREAALQHAAAFLAPALAAATGLSMPEAVGGGSLGAAARGGALTIAGGGRRHRLLRLRAANPEAFAREWPRPIPLSEAEIQNSAPLKRLLALEAAGGFKVERKGDKGGLKSLGFAYGEGEGSVSALMAARAKARAHNYLARIKASKGGQAKYGGGGMAELSRLVRDVRLPTLGGIDLSAIGDIFKPKRSLHPSASGKGVAAAAQQALSAEAIRGGDADGASQAKHYIKVHLVRAVNVPRRAGLAALGALGENLGGDELVRRSGTRGYCSPLHPARGNSSRFQETGGGYGDQGPGSPIPGMPQGGRMHGMDSSWAAFNEGAEVWAGGAEDVQVRCVAEVTFRGAKTTSRGAVGPTPTWNQVLELPLTVPGDSVTPVALASLSSPVTVALFDEVVVERSVGPYSRATTKTLRERRFLGQFSVPFDALYSAGRVEAQMRLSLPTVLFGYAPSSASAGGDGAMSSTDLPDSQGLVMAAETNRRASHVVMALSVDPPLPPPPPMDSNIDKLFGASWFTALQRAARRSLRPRTHAAIAGPPLILGPAPSTTQTATPSASQPARTPSAPVAALGTAPTMNSDSDYRRLMSQCYSWAAAAAKRTGRAVQAVVEDIEQQPRLVTQFITPLQPPPALATAQPVGVEGGPSTPRRLRGAGSSESSEGGASRQHGGSSFRSSASQGAGVEVGELGEQLLVGPPMATSEEVTRFVALVPFLSDIDVFGRHADVWATCAQTLDMGAGDFEEHALLLLNYLMWLNSPDNGGSGIWDDYLVLGSTHDSGESAWVLRYYARTNQVVLINPCSGRSYLGLDATCPLNNIGMLANNKNCYANVQGSGQPWRMRFDVTSTRDWMPMWAPGSDVIPPSTIQEPIVYTAPNESFVEQLQDDVAERLQREFQTWRRSAGHPSCRLTLKFTDKLSMLLEDLEQIASTQGAPPGTGDGGVGARAVAGIILDHTQQLSASLSRHDLFGFPLCVPFRDLADVVDHVKHVGLHDTEAEHVEFAIECKIVAYANYVMAVWVYLLAVRPK